MTAGYMVCNDITVGDWQVRSPTMTIGNSGDLTATGTPSGVGFAMTPQLFLKVGDVVRAEIHHVGFIDRAH